MKRTFKCTLTGRVRILKNGKRFFYRGKGKKAIVLPSKIYEPWEKTAAAELKQCRYTNGEFEMFKGPVNLACKFYFKDHQGEPDLSNCYQGVEDLLQKVGIIENDKLIYSHDGSKKIFGEEPRVEIEVTEL